MENGVKSIQAAAYNGASTVCELYLRNKLSQKTSFFPESDSDNNEVLDIEQHKLPTAQQEALENLIKDVKWMILDEIAFALTTHAAKINEFTLKTVARHISSSHGKPGCSMIQIPLTYVFGHEVSKRQFNYYVRVLGGFFEPPTYLPT